MIDKDNKDSKDNKEDITIVIDGVEFKAKHRKFKSGRVGYGLYGLTKIRGYPHRLSINIIEV
jgi:hypothetical protein